MKTCCDGKRKPPPINKPEHCIYEVTGARKRGERKASSSSGMQTGKGEKKVDGREKGQKSGQW